MKQDFGTESFNLKDFYATAAALIFSMIAYNLMSLFRLFVLQEKTQKTLSTLRYRTFAIGAYFERAGDTLKLKIALTKKTTKMVHRTMGLSDKAKPKYSYRVIWVKL